ncbi:MAG: hypothetical protein A3D24_01840 [Candidatus Blackburnbacteria bacterium RIFCSPHIGHO2_02_FULL_39_13]|uniref:Glycosyltransferase 2-like domain-containing protein n=1 Tax=Candidatus Blackburnbacteria bacterium RIFCSPLOWO2_01_FULL_40_20 TaxID=1797519 RepID=A0A1G1VC88_9BACT|nr:MAG: Glycosyl transferase family 2 [Microgenomates group bacterium GW2011_GWA2_39_19]OGY06861.1 MAG: hypothetical protein A2694_00890 [Candidatus Blackburnbacteria bacterium RIFCSPHIGHO2_01_FULL_40_17]OGY07962.1 MAG: hypothetical protein A3D24_01840 [Candidatus Blackburnbacteria bacterium RIFCSPHIGHO2_02_FULL_39_13]OGY13019.1 MAG: hypothetical protein A3A77_01745 [Candidatus Blackburnbacteria bacterium RIFCSPLOWO2_01_FULL_40_20]HBL51789.1 glycosyltransferase family 2 protein [Candidatus Blac
MTQKAPSISVFFPCYNDSKSIGVLVESSISLLPKLTEDYEVIVIDDGSKDDSRDVLNKLAKKYEKLKLVFHEKNRGYGGALQSGFKTASKDLVFYTDGDGQYDMNEFPLLLNLMTKDVNFVNGIKMDRRDAEYRVVAGNLYKFITRWAFWLPIYDVDCDFRLIRKELVKKLKLTSSSGSICVELVKKAERAGGKFRQTSVHHYERKWGKSQFFRLDRIAKTYKDLLALWIRLMVLRK